MWRFLTYIMKLSWIGVAVGAGWQSVGAYVNIACYYLIGVPVGVVLGYVYNMEVKVSYLYPLFHVFYLIKIDIIISD